MLWLASLVKQMGGGSCPLLTHLLQSWHWKNVLNCFCASINLCLVLVFLPNVLRGSCICLQGGPSVGVLHSVNVCLWLSHSLSDAAILPADVDECTNGTVCGTHGFCENMDGSYRCLCYQGYQDTQDGQGCTGELVGASSHCCKVQGSKNSIPTKHISHFCFLTFFY